MKTTICKFLLLLSLVVSTTPSWAQSPDLSAKIDAAVQQMDAGLYDQSKTLLEEVIAVDAGNFKAWYELAHLHYMKKEYNTALKLALKSAKLSGASELAWQLAGNAAYMAGDSQRADVLYQRGQKHFPDSGLLYYEQGVVALNNRKYNRDFAKALECFETGIAVDPKFASNYYAVAKIHLCSAEPVWGLFYGEMFLNLESAGNRAREISSLLYDIYKERIVIGTKDGERQVAVRFAKDQTVGLNGMNLMVSFPPIYSITLQSAVPSDVTRIDLESLCRIRHKVVADFCASQGVLSQYMNVLFEYQHKIAKAGHFDAYTYWLLGNGDPEKFGEWVKTHGEQWKSFVGWMGRNPLVVDKGRCFNRKQYDRVPVNSSAE